MKAEQEKTVKPTIVRGEKKVFSDEKDQKFVLAHILNKKHITSKLLGCQSINPEYVIGKIESGISTNIYTRLAKKMNLTSAELADAISINTRTLSRRKGEGKISSTESDRLYRLTVLFVEAVYLFDGNYDLASEWFKKGNPALNGNTPLSYAKTHIGANEVNDLIYRLEHNIAV